MNGWLLIIFWSVGRQAVDIEQVKMPDRITCDTARGAIERSFQVRWAESAPITACVSTITASVEK